MGELELEIRNASIAGVRHGDRIIELVVMPYNAEAIVRHEGRMVREVCLPGAFAGLERRANRIRVNRDHDPQRTIGRALTFHTDRDEGLISELRVARTPLGDETLELADEGILDASAGFLPMPGGESWHERRTLRKLHKVWLGHIALTPDPAYVDARVLAVRDADPPAPPAPRAALPNLDALRERELLARYVELDAKYGVR
jgi:HK97 family phage prohead protease